MFRIEGQDEHVRRIDWKPEVVGWRFEDTYARLPDVLHAPATPAAVREPRVSILNHRLADELGLDFRAMSPDAAAALFAGQDLPGRLPIAQAYAGHQYGGFTMLGDGRAILLGEHRTPDGRLVDIQLKGAGPDAVLPRRRRPGRPRADAPRVRHQRGDGRPRHPHHPQSRGRHHRRTGLTGRPRARGRS